MQRLMDGYRGRAADGAVPELRDRADVVAYAAYRMPATFGAVSAALGALAERTGGWAPRSHLDVGGGTGAALWAAAGVWAGTRHTTVLDRSPAALAVGRELAGTRGDLGDRPTGGGAAGGPERGAAGGVEWRRGTLPPSAADPLPEAELVTVSYVLGELDGADRSALVESAAASARGAVVVVEPGTPDGYLRIRAAREQLTGAGLRILAPCPHGGRCPVEPGADWCHFAARVPRSSLHRRAKGGTLPYEDEKFSYVAAVRTDAVEAAPAAGRIVRRPQQRKGQVLLDLCATGPEELRRTTVSKRHGPLYRAARDAGWGDAWPPDTRTPGTGSPETGSPDTGSSDTGSGDA